MGFLRDGGIIDSKTNGGRKKLFLSVIRGILSLKAAVVSTILWMNRPQKIRFAAAQRKSESQPIDQNGILSGMLFMRRLYHG